MTKSLGSKIKSVGFIVAATATMSLFYVNCSGARFGSLGNPSQGSQLSSGGGGIDGMVSYYSYGDCGNGVIKAMNIINVSSDHLTGTLVLQNCTPLIQPTSVAMSQVTFSLTDQNTFIADGKIYDLHTGVVDQRVTFSFCQSAGPGSTQALLWQNLNSPSSYKGSVTQGNGAGTGALNVSPPLSSTPNVYASAPSQSSQLDLILTSATSGKLSYEIESSAMISAENVNCLSQAMPTLSSTQGAVTSLHYTPNSNFSSSGQYTPGSAGFNLADVSSLTELSGLPAGVQGLVWLGLCDGADAEFISAVSPYIGNQKLFGFYLMDTPDPSGQYSTLCTAANLKAESDWIHANLSGAKTFIVLMNMGTDMVPSYADTYTSLNTDIDLFGLNPYPCQTEFNGCNYSIIGAAVSAAEAAGISQAQIIPVYQSFGGSAWSMPTANQEQQILSSWAPFSPNPVFDFSYSWGEQDSDTSLQGSPAQQAVFQAHNAIVSPSPTPTP